MKKILILWISLVLLLAACGSEYNGTEKESEMSTENQDIPTLTEANNQLAFDLLSNVEVDDAGNLFLSSTSLYFALSMAYNGADGETKQEMSKLLGFGESGLEALNASNYALLQTLIEEKDDIELHIANSLWLNQNYQFEDAFRKQTEDYYQATIEEIDVSNEESRATINQWVEDQTNERIKDIIKDPLDPNLVSILINTIYFDGNWMYPFDVSLTATEEFKLEDGSTKNVDMMLLAEDLEYLRTSEFQAVSLPYGEGEMSMKLFLPLEGKSLEESFTLENWQEWQAGFQVEAGQVKLPTFELEYETTLNAALQSLGIEKAFDEQEADFSKMVAETDDMHISNILQKTFLLVDEEGTEAAAATAVEFETTSAPINEPFNITFNRPFYLFITDNETDTILFSGKIANPTEKE